MVKAALAKKKPPGQKPDLSDNLSQNIFKNILTARAAFISLSAV